MKSSIAEDIQISNSIPVSLIKLQTRLLHLIPTRSPLIDWHNILVSSSVATKAGTGGHAPPPTVDRHGHRIRANPRKTFGGEGCGGSDSSLPDLLADRDGARCAVPPQKNPPVHRPFGPRHRCTPNFEILATPLLVSQVLSSAITVKRWSSSHG